MSDPSIPDLEAQLTEAKEATAQAERELGVAVVDGKGERSARKRLEDARAECERITAAIDEQRRREEQAEAERHSRKAKRGRIAVYESIRDYHALLAPMLKLREELRAAEAEVRSRINLSPRAKTLLFNRAEGRGANRRTLSELDDLDVELLMGTPEPPRGKKRIDNLPEQLTAADCEARAARAQELVDAEQRGEEIAKTGEQYQAERQARRDRRRRRNQRKREEEKAAAQRAHDQREEAEAAKRDKREGARRKELAGNASARAEQRGGSEVPYVLHMIDRQAAGLGDSR